MLSAARKIAGVIVFGGLMLPATAHGQVVGRFAIGAGVLAGSDTRDSRYQAHIVGRGADVSFKTTSRLSLGVELDVPQTRSYELTGSLRRTDGTEATYFRRWTFRGSIVSAVVGIHAATIGPLDFWFVTGFGIESRRFGDFLTEDTLDAEGHVARHDVIATPYDGKIYRWTQAPLGFDAAIRLSRHIALVPQLRYYFNPLAFMNDGCCDGGQARARVSARWMF